MTKKVYTTTIEDAEDGSGDGILTFPPEILEETGWKEGQLLKLSYIDDKIYITTVEKE